MAQKLTNSLGDSLKEVFLPVTYISIYDRGSLDKSYDFATLNIRATYHFYK